MLLYLLIDISVVLVFRSWSSLRPLSCNDNPVKTFNDVTGQVYHLHDLLELFLRILKAFWNFSVFPKMLIAAVLCVSGLAQQAAWW